MKNALTPTHHLLLLLAILGLALFLRLWRLDVMPPGFYHDEAYNALDALALSRGEAFPQFHEGWELYAHTAHGDRPITPTRYPIFFEGNYGREPLHIYLMALSIHLFGPTIWAVRLVPALMGTIGVFTTWLCACVLFSAHPHRRPLALIAAFTVATLFPAIHFSHFGLRMMMFLPVQTLAVATFTQGIQQYQRQKRVRTLWWWWGITGALVGFGLYTYAASRLFPLFFVGVYVAMAWRNRSWRAQWPIFVGLGVVAILVALPMLIYFARYPYFLFFRTAYVANKGMGTVEGKAWLTWLLNIGRVWRGLYWWGETHLRHNLVGRPFLDLIQAVLLTIGLGQAARHHHARPLWLWLWIMLLPSIMSGDAPHFGRMSGAIAPLALLVGYGAISAWQWLGTTRLTGRVIASLLLVSGGWTTYDYFVRYANNPALDNGSYPSAEGFYRGDWEIGRWIAQQSADSVLYFAPPQEEMATIFFAYGHDREKVRSYQGGSSLLPLGRPDKPIHYIVRPNHTAALEQLAAFYGEAYSAEVTADSVRVTIPAQLNRLTTRHQSALAYHPSLQLVGWQIDQSASAVIVTLIWQKTGPLSADYTTFIHLLDADGTLLTQQDRPPAGYPTRDWRDGELIRDQFTLSYTGRFTQLRTGWYDPATLAPFGEAILLTPR